ncbi:MAG: hypothetical protein AB7G75_18215 [Candidatus Binatia bacterium]
MPFRRLVTRAFFLVIVMPIQVWAQDLAPDVHPAPLVRITGVLEALREPRPVLFPVLRVWIDKTPRVFRVAHIEAVIPAYPAEEYLQKVSSLGLRLVAGGAVRTLLLSPTMHDRPIVIEGWLQPKAGVLRVRSVEEKSKD